MRPCYFDFEQSQARRMKSIAMARPNAWHRLPPPPRPRKWLLGLWTATAALCRTWRNRIRSRRELAALDARMRRDIGASPSDIAHELGKPFWRA